MNSNLENRKELNNLTEEIIACAEQNKHKVPKGFSVFDKEKIGSIQDAFIYLEKLFMAEEKEIENRQLHTFVTVDYEDDVRRFAVSIVILLYPEHEKLRAYDTYQRLLTRKHMAYAFFHVMNSRLLRTEEDIDIFSAFYERLYLGMADFYEGFYGRFSDNEEAIELLCKFFPKKMNIEEYGAKIAAVLYVHVSNAGTPEDRGYAFRGIDKMERYIVNLPEEIVTKLLGHYHVNLIISNEVFRHQVYTMIEYAQISRVDKQVCKFLYLDSVVLAWQMEKYLVQQLTEDNPDESFTSMIFEDNYITGAVRVCEKPNAYWMYWNYGETGERFFSVDGEDVLQILLKNSEEIEINKLNHKGSAKTLKLSYEYSDWRLENYFSKEVEQKFRKLILGSESRYSQMFFSLLYLEHYRGMNDRLIDFDHKFQYDRTSRHLQRQKENTYQIGRFYGQSVKTLSCIVGKNGTGKTSIIDFLRESFFKLLRLIEDYGIPCAEGYIREEDYREYDVLDEGAKFFIVFRIGTKPFFLTNVEKVVSEDVEPFAAGIYNSINEFSKVAYFSNMLNNNQAGIFLDGTNRTGNEQEQTKREIGRSLSGFRQVDYSETESFIRRQKAIMLEQERELAIDEDRAETKGSVNRELCYQFTFLKSMSANKVCEYLDIDEQKRFKIVSRMNGWTEEEFTLRDLQDPVRLRRMEEKYLFFPDAQLQYFSSGQYVKFAFLAKLYWFLEGYDKEIERYRSMVGENEFRREDALLSGETALLFIDEGETYYHPEWQRRYMKTLLEMVNDNNRNFQIQIVITTNSPFILSDILQDDVTYLSEKTEKRFERTLGQNIHRLLKENFFMDYTIGEYARELIENMMLCLDHSDNEGAEKQRKNIKNMIQRYYGKEKEAYPAIQLLIEQIGEPVYRYELEKLLNESALMKEYRTMERLLEEKRRIEEEIQELEKKG